MFSENFQRTNQLTRNYDASVFLVYFSMLVFSLLFRQVGTLASYSPPNKPTPMAAPCRPILITRVGKKHAFFKKSKHSTVFSVLNVFFSLFKTFSIMIDIAASHNTESVQHTYDML